MPYIDNQYASAGDLLSSDSLINIVSENDKQRIKAYRLYENMYRNSPDTFEVVLRGDEDDPSSIYIPTCKKYVNTTARFLAVDFDYIIDEENEVTGQDDLKKQLNTFLRKLFAREKIYSKFIQQKKWGLAWGDQVYHITADDTKREGERISIHVLHPGKYFPIEEDTGTGTRIIGCHIVDLVQDPRETDTKKSVARRQTYRKQKTEDGTGYTGLITTELRLFEEGKWDDRHPDNEIVNVKTLVEEKTLPATITQIPVYHIANDPPNGSSWGSSQVSGLETIITAINQGATDEDLTITMQGMGVYVSSAGPPVDPATGQQGTYKVGPRDVVEISEGQDFKRVSGLSSVSPFQDHLSYLNAEAQTAIGIPDMATGVVDVSLAESGIALALKMGPIIAENADKELEILAVWNNMLYDLVNMWIKEYEKIDFKAIPVTATTGDPMPVNREKKIQEVILLFTSGLITIEQAQDALSELGWEFTDGDAAKALQQQAIISGAASLNENPEGNQNEEDETSTSGSLQVGRNGSQLELSNL